MLTFLWIPATVAAAALQVARNALQRGLLGKSGPWAATLVRFMFGLPFSYAIALAVGALTPGHALHFTPTFLVTALSGALAQVLATSALLVAMHRAGFGVATAMQQSSLPLAAVLGLLIFGDRLSGGAWAGVAVTTAGLIALTWPARGPGRDAASVSGPRPISGGLFGILSGLVFGYNLNAYRHAALALDPLHPLFSAVATVAFTQTVQTMVLSAILAIWDPAALRHVIASWRRSLAAGLFGSLASCGWLVALALAPAAQVRAVGVIEAPIAALAGRRLFKERLHIKQIVAGAAVLLGVLMTTLG